MNEWNEETEKKTSTKILESRFETHRTWLGDEEIRYFNDSYQIPIFTFIIKEFECRLSSYDFN